VLDWTLFPPIFCATYRLAERSALANCDDVSLLDTEGRRNVGGQVAMSLLVSGVLGNEVEIFSSDNDGSVHLGRDHFAGQDSSSNGDHASEWAFLVYNRISAFCSFFAVPPRAPDPGPASIADIPM